MRSLHNPGHVSPRESILAAMRRNPAAEVTAYDIATRAGVTPKKAGHYLSDMAGSGDVVRVPSRGTREAARYRLAESGEGAGA